MPVALLALGHGSRRTMGHVLNACGRRQARKFNADCEFVMGITIYNLTRCPLPKASRRLQTAAARRLVGGDRPPCRPMGGDRSLLSRFPPPGTYL